MLFGDDEGRGPCALLLFPHYDDGSEPMLIQCSLCCLAIRATTLFVLIIRTRSSLP